MMYTSYRHLAISFLENVEIMLPWGVLGKQKSQPTVNQRGGHLKQIWTVRSPQLRVQQVSLLCTISFFASMHGLGNVISNIVFRKWLIH